MLPSCNVVSVNKHNKNYAYFNFINYAYLTSLILLYVCFFTVITCLVITIVLDIFYQ